MAQKRFTTYRAAVESFPLGEQNIGLIKPGRFNGFDVMSSAGGLTINIGHSGGIPKTTNTGTPSNTFGAVVMPTGVIIHEYDEITIVVTGDGDTEGEVGSVRQDLVVCEHNYSEVEGGVDATYFIITGDWVSVPSLPDPTKQVALGIIEVEAGATTYAGITWKPYPAPLPGDMDEAALFAYIQQQVIQVVGSGGEINLGSNLGTTGVSVFSHKDGTILYFRKLVSTNDSLSMTQTSNAINFQINEAHQGGTINNHNPQLEVDDNLLLNNNHAGKTLYVDPAGSVITITVPGTLVNTFAVGVIQVGLGTVQFTGSSGAIIEVPPLTGLKIRGKNYSVYLEKRASTSTTFHLLGDTKV